MMKPSVTAAILCYNQINTIEQTLQSVTDQRPMRHFEVVIADDCSTDGTREVCDQFSKSSSVPARCLPPEANLGVALNFERLLNSCNTDYIAICEGDDYWTSPDKIESQASFLDDNPDTALVFTDSVDLNEVNPRRTRARTWRQEGVPKEFGLAFLLRRGWFIRTPTIMIRREVVHALPKYFNSLYSTDYFLHIAATQVGQIAHLPIHPSAVYRVHQGGISHRGNILTFARRKIAYLHHLPPIVFRSKSPGVALAALLHTTDVLKQCLIELARPILRRPMF